MGKKGRLDLIVPQIRENGEVFGRSIISPHTKNRFAEKMGGQGHSLFSPHRHTAVAQTFFVFLLSTLHRTRCTTIGRGKEREGRLNKRRRRLHNIHGGDGGMKESLLSDLEDALFRDAVSLKINGENYF